MIFYFGDLLQTTTYRTIFWLEMVRLFFFAGFGDAVNNSECWNPVIKYVEDQFDQFLDAESKVERIPMRDSRVHVCLYFIAPTGHCLKPLDIEFMKRIHEKVIFNFQPSFQIGLT